jgi:hypothetical protein
MTHVTIQDLRKIQDHIPDLEKFTDNKHLIPFFQDDGTFLLVPLWAALSQPEGLPIHIPSPSYDQDTTIKTIWLEEDYRLSPEELRKTRFKLLHEHGWLQITRESRGLCYQAMCAEFIIRNYVLGSSDDININSSVWSTFEEFEL